MPRIKEEALDSDIEIPPSSGLQPIRRNGARASSLIRQETPVSEEDAPPPSGRRRARQSAVDTNSVVKRETSISEDDAPPPSNRRRTRQYAANINSIVEREAAALGADAPHPRIRRNTRQNIESENSSVKIYPVRKPAPISPFSCSAFDEERRIFYVVGGSLPEDPSASNFYAFHLADMRWENLTVRQHDASCIPSLQLLVLMRDRVRYDPCTTDLFGQKPCRRLLYIYNAYTWIFRKNGHKFLMVYGGLKEDNNLSSDFVCIDLQELMWWPVIVKGGSILPREAACVTIIKDQLFIFSGFLHGADGHCA